MSSFRDRKRSDSILSTGSVSTNSSPARSRASSFISRPLELLSSVPSTAAIPRVLSEANIADRQQQRSESTDEFCQDGTSEHSSPASSTGRSVDAAEEARLRSVQKKHMQDVPSPVKLPDAAKQPQKLRKRKGSKVTIRAPTDYDDSDPPSDSIQLMKHVLHKNVIRDDNDAADSSNENEASEVEYPTANEFSLKQYFFGSQLHVLPTLHDLDAESKARISQAAKRRRVLSFLQIPWATERVLDLGVVMCADAFLSVFTIMPLRALAGVWSVLTGRVKSMSMASAIDLVRIVLLIVTALLLEFAPWANFSRMYHIIRGESSLKLYVIFNCLDVFDKLLCSIGQDILDSLMWTASTLRSHRRFRNVMRFCADFLMGTIYISLHTMLLLAQVVTLNVAIYSSSNQLLTLLISNNFAEMKTNVFKRAEKENLFQISCSDMVERFHLLTFAFAIALQNSLAARFGWEEMKMIGYVFGTELVIDSVKHAFICKFNYISSDVYSKFKAILCVDVTKNINHDTFQDSTTTVCRRIGFMPLPLACLLLRTICRSFKWSEVSPVLVVTSFLCLLLTKVVINVALVGHCGLYRERVFKNTQNRLSGGDVSEGSESEDNRSGKSGPPTSAPFNTLRSSIEKVSDPGSSDRDSLGLGMQEVQRYSVWKNRVP